jgi:hypothetical protein
MITEFNDNHHDDKIEYRYVELITVYEAANEGELAFVKGLLESNEIDYYAKGEYIAPIEGLGSVGGFNPLFGPITVQVAPDDVEKQKSLSMNSSITRTFDGNHRNNDNGTLISNDK